MAFGFAQAAAGLIVDRLRHSAEALEYVVDFAQAYTDTVSVIVCGDAGDPGPAEARVRWLRAKFPGIDIRQLEPLSPVMARSPGTEAWAGQIRDAARSAGSSLLFGSGGEDHALARAIGATLVPVCLPADTLRPAAAEMQAVGAVKKNVEPLRVCLFGPESTGKSTLAAALAGHYRTVHVPEYVRSFLDATGSAGTALDVPWIARGQLASETVLAQRVDRLLICDTNLATVVLWSDVLFGGTPDWIREQADAQKYDLWLLTGIDVPFEPDPQRVFPDPVQRAWFMRECERTLEQRGIAPLPLHGSPAARLELACAAIDSILASRTGTRHR